MAAPLAIVSAMHEELRALLPALAGPQTTRLAGRDFHTGRLLGQPVVMVLSGIGKVAAATTAALLIHEYDAQALVFTGVAGGLGTGVNVGDVVIASELLQHDMDASPLFPRFEVPLTGRSHFAADTALAAALKASAERCVAAAHTGPDAAHRHALGIGPSRVHQGLVVSGDRFVATSAESAALRALLPQALAVEMEGAALAQVCADFGRPFAVLRTSPTGRTTPRMSTSAASSTRWRACHPRDRSRHWLAEPPLTMLRDVLKAAWRAVRGVLLALAAVVSSSRNGAGGRSRRWPRGWRSGRRWRGSRRGSRALPPRWALADFLVPAVLLFPVKLLALWFIHQGSTALGVGVIVAAKLLGTALVGRLFILTEAQLTQYAWFARALAWWRSTKERVKAAVRRSRSWRAARAAAHAGQRWWRRLGR